MATRTVTAATAYPVSVAEAKAYLNLDSSADDTLIQALIEAAVDQAENMTRRQFCQATFEIVLDEFPQSDPYGVYAIELPGAPLQSVTSITYTDTDGDEQTVGSGDYTVDTASIVGRVYPAYGESWPSTREIPNAVVIRYVAGWAMDDSTSPETWTGPESIKAWIKARVATLYEHREQFVVGQSVAEMPRTFIDTLLDAWTIPEVA